MSSWTNWIQDWWWSHLLRALGFSTNHHLRHSLKPDQPDPTLPPAGSTVEHPSHLTFHPQPPRIDARIPSSQGYSSSRSRAYIFTADPPTTLKYPLSDPINYTCYQSSRTTSWRNLRKSRAGAHPKTTDLLCWNTPSLDAGRPPETHPL